MKTLLKKEFGFTAISLTYMFIAFSAMAFLPGYPILCGPFFVCLGIFYTFQIAREGNDALYTALLPVRKRDVVKARYLFVVIIQAISFALITIITIIRMTLLSGASAYVQNALMNANLFYLGGTLLIFTCFNTMFCGGFWKDAYRIGKPFLFAAIGIFVVITIFEAAHHVPGMEALNTPFGCMGVQLGTLIAGIIIYVFGTILSCKKAMSNFERIDLTL